MQCPKLAQWRAQYARNAHSLMEMLDAAKRVTSGQYRGYTVAELEARYAEYHRYAAMTDTELRAHLNRLRSRARDRTQRYPTEPTTMTNTTNDTPRTGDAIVADARERGERAGRAAASWKFDGNTTERTYADFVRAYDDGDPMILDIYAPPAWLSGEWAGESVPELLSVILRVRGIVGDLIDEYKAVEGDPHDDYSTETICEAYEQGADAAYWAELETTARRALEK